MAEQTRVIERAPRAEKVAVVDDVRERMSSASATLLTEYRGLKVSELAELRRAVRAVGGDYKIYKNTLVRFAVRDLGIEGVEELLVGPTAVAFVDGDAAAVAKALRDFGRTNPNLVIKGGVLGSKALSADDTRALADLPSREVLLARLAGAFQAPMQQFAGLLAALPRNFAYGLKALIDDKGGVPEDAAPAGEPEPAVEAEVIDEPQPFVQVEAVDGEALPTAPPEDAPVAEATDAAPADEAATETSESSENNAEEA
ncbi:MAG: 50S ribosomal protein L10 [Acidobacteria bacterium]|nr:50S ribosomal protein L10 [Acidobacteriota bacterium]